MTQEAIREIIRRQREFFYTGATLNIDFRIEALKKLQASIQAHQEQIDAALKADLGKRIIRFFSPLTLWQMRLLPETQQSLSQVLILLPPELLSVKSSGNAFRSTM